MLTINNKLLRIGNMGFANWSLPYIDFEFSVADFVPTTSLIAGNYRNIVKWVQQSSSPNVWRLQIYGWITIQEQTGTGTTFLFSDTTSQNPGKLIPNNLGGGTCRIIGSGNFDKNIGGIYCNSFDRMFCNCTGLTEIVTPIKCNNLINVSSMFTGCTNVTSGALAQYNWLNTYGTQITNHSGAFTDCGRNTQTGLAELNQIPFGWGGLLYPASTTITGTVGAYSGSNKTYWTFTTQVDTPDWSQSVNKLYLFTAVSVSQYAGVSMNRTRIPNTINGLGTNTSYALYFYPAFVQTDKVPGSSGNAATWILATESPNGSLAVGQGNTDMPGTLDFNTYGKFTHEFGTYDSTKTVYFVFFVTNTPLDNWSLSSGYAFLYNTGFRDTYFKWFYET